MFTTESFASPLRPSPERQGHSVSNLIYQFDYTKPYSKSKVDKTSFDLGGSESDILKPQFDIVKTRFTGLVPRPYNSRSHVSLSLPRNVALQNGVLNNSLSNSQSGSLSSSNHSLSGSSPHVNNTAPLRKTPPKGSSSSGSPSMNNSVSKRPDLPNGMNPSRQLQRPRSVQLGMTQPQANNSDPWKGVVLRRSREQLDDPSKRHSFAGTQSNRKCSIPESMKHGSIPEGHSSSSSSSRQSDSPGVQTNRKSSIPGVQGSNKHSNSPSRQSNRHGSTSSIQSNRKSSIPEMNAKRNSNPATQSNRHSYAGTQSNSRQSSNSSSPNNQSNQQTSGCQVYKPGYVTHGTNRYSDIPGNRGIPTLNNNIYTHQASTVVIRRRDSDDRRRGESKDRPRSTATESSKPAPNTAQSLSQSRAQFFSSLTSLNTPDVPTIPGEAMLGKAIGMMPPTPVSTTSMGGSVNKSMIGCGANVVTRTGTRADALTGARRVDPRDLFPNKTGTTSSRIGAENAKAAVAINESTITLGTRVGIGSVSPIKPMSTSGYSTTNAEISRIETMPKARNVPKTEIVARTGLLARTGTLSDKIETLPKEEVVTRKEPNAMVEIALTTEITPRSETVFKTETLPESKSLARSEPMIRSEPIGRSKTPPKIETKIKSELLIGNEIAPNVESVMKTETVIKNEISSKTVLRSEVLPKTETAIRNEPMGKCKIPPKIEIPIGTETTVKPEIPPKTKTAVRVETMVKPEIPLKTETTVRNGAMAISEISPNIDAGLRTENLATHQISPNTESAVRIESKVQSEISFKTNSAARIETVLKAEGIPRIEATFKSEPMPCTETVLRVVTDTLAKDDAITKMEPVLKTEFATDTNTTNTNTTTKIRTTQKPETLEPKTMEPVRPLSVSLMGTEVMSSILGRTRPESWAGPITTSGGEGPAVFNPCEIGLAGVEGRAITILRPRPSSAGRANRASNRKFVIQELEEVCEDQNRNKTTKSSTSAAASGTTSAKRAGNQPDVVTQVAPPGAAAEIGRLEALCETRTKQLNIARMQLKTSAQGFDAMTVLVKYLTDELDAFSCPAVTAKLKSVKGQLAEAQQQIDLLAEEKATLEKSLGDLKTQHAAKVTQVKDAHREELQQLQQRLLAEKDTEVEKVVEKYSLEVTTLKSFLEKNITEMKTKHEKTLAENEVQQVKEVKQLKEDHDGHCQDLQKQHEHRMEEITRTFENIKFALSEKVETLREECEEMRSREAHLEARTQREADMKVHMALAQYKHLPAEIESLKAVMEMRNQELHELRHRKLELEKQLEEIPVAREKIISLQQKVENLEAVIQIKADYEKQLAEKHQLLLRKFDKEYKANKRLSMDNEELAWRLANSAESPDLLRRSISHSPTRASAEPTPEIVRRRRSPACSIPTSPRNQTEFDRSPVMLQSPPKTNLKRSGTYDLLNKEPDEKDLKQSDV